MESFMTKLNILIVGDVMLDRYLHGDTSRVSPEAPVPVVHLKKVDYKPGGAANVALNVTALGVSSKVIGLVGKDETAMLLRKSLQETGIEDGLIELDDAVTISKSRVISRHQQLMRLDEEDGFASFDHSKLMERVELDLPDAAVMILSDYNKGTISPILQPLIQLAKKHGVPVLVDPKTSDFSLYAGATLLTPNMSEFEAAVGMCQDEKDMLEKAAVLIEQCDWQAVLITRSEKGMSLVRDANNAMHLPAQVRDVFDVTGAGDTVIAVVATMLAQGNNLEAAARAANVAAGIVVGKLGAASVSFDELSRAMQTKPGEVCTESSIVSEKELVNVVGDAKARGEVIIMTNGCFDILHAGHVRYLQQARNMGDKLIVVVNDDASVRRLKGEARPVNTLANRMQLLAALEMVDWVVAFSEDTPKRLICAILPDKLVKGGDYKPTDIAGYDCVTGNGGEVVVLDYHEGLSTSKTIQGIIDGLKN
ncbi:MAG: bifunctional D-glycero-beta-D-manno-heptose-7-phosphate kinase/D-glycero-beta-D-manno-heptose 1-phosphate adenylyltransferase HldE [Gammaproteobacteria bacterium]|nr:bifunctional D-glycero-beta-D-manno-heptose-7-phosphate kinase/D-glycero-beta-D-manno-heptose 1-phosphate adenylyltransferase HldE [Gammaproteobacteria bacterium]